MKPTRRIPTPTTIREAQAALRELAPLIQGRGRAQRAVRVSAEGVVGAHPVNVPLLAFKLFLEILGQLASGNAAAILPVHAEFTTQQAAELLNVSRPFVVKLIEEGAIPCRRVGTHRRIRASDLLAYKQKDDAHRRQVLNELAEEGQGLGLGY